MIKAHTNSQRWEQRTGPAQVYTRSFIYIQPPVEASLSVRMSRSLYLALSLERFPSVLFYSNMLVFIIITILYFIF